MNKCGTCKHYIGGCDECCVGNIVVETTEDCGKFAPDCDSCDVKDCDETACHRAGVV